jgi:glycosyltransferase involved in cell wall biosynthesis
VSVGASARRLAAPPARLVARGLVAARTAHWPDYSRLFAVGDRGGWSVDEDAAHLAGAARRLGFSVGPSSWASLAARQSVFLSSHFEALGPFWPGSSHRLATAYLHGRPDTPGVPEFDECYERLRRHPDRLDRIQVTHAEMHELVLSAGVDPGRVFRIPIGIDLEHFPFAGPALRASAREALGLPASAFVLGSFQKDGVGWDEGLEPKLVKGPDVLVALAERVREEIPELAVLLTGPARGFVRHELGRRSIPFVHALARSRSELARAYRALDVYVVTSRQEGGPKAMFEAMASGVPFVTTRVGQAQELVEDGRNGMLCDVEDVGALAGAVVRVAEDESLRDALCAAGRRTAEAYALEMLDPEWQKLLDGFVLRSPADGR